MNEQINWISVGIKIIFAFYDNPISHGITKYRACARERPSQSSRTIK